MPCVGKAKEQGLIRDFDAASMRCDAIRCMQSVNVNDRRRRRRLKSMLALASCQWQRNRRRFRHRLARASLSPQRRHRQAFQKTKGNKGSERPQGGYQTKGMDDSHIWPTVLETPVACLYRFYTAFPTPAAIEMMYHTPPPPPPPSPAQVTSINKKSLIRNFMNARQARDNALNAAVYERMQSAKGSKDTSVGTNGSKHVHIDADETIGARKETVVGAPPVTDNRITNEAEDIVPSVLPTTGASQASPLQTSASSVKASSRLPKKLFAEQPLSRSFLSSYSVSAYLNSGAFGIVVACERISDKRQVAVKLIPRKRLHKSSFMYDPDLKMDVPREVYFLRRCKHEGIVGFECWSSDERWGYLVMELCASIPSPAPKTQTHDGQVLSPPTVSRPTIQRSASHDLFDHLSVHRRLPEASSKHIFSQLLDAVTYLHERHIVHLDLKDENIIISPTNTVKLIDFGSAAYSTSPSPTCPDFEPANPVEKLFSQFRGTEASAPPEVVVGRAFKGKPADIWALGVLLYTMLTGKPPFADAYGICHGRLKVEGLGDQVAEVLRGCLEKRPEERWTVAQISQCQWVRGLENATPSDLE